MYCAVTTLPVITVFLSGFTIIHFPWYWLLNLRLFNAPQAWVKTTFFNLSSRLSDTKGRPSGKRSPFHCAVREIMYSLFIATLLNCCAFAIIVAEINTRKNIKAAIVFFIFLLFK